MPQSQSAPEQSGRSVNEAVRLKELELELQSLALKEELHYIHALEPNKLEQQTKIRLLELEQGAAFSTTARYNFDVSKNIRLVLKIVLILIN